MRMWRGRGTQVVKRMREGDRGTHLRGAGAKSYRSCVVLCQGTVKKAAAAYCCRALAVLFALYRRRHGGISYTLGSPASAPYAI